MTFHYQSWKRKQQRAEIMFFSFHFDISSLFVDHFVLRLLHFLWLQLCRPGDTKDNGRGAVTWKTPDDSDTWSTTKKQNQRTNATTTKTWIVVKMKMGPWLLKSHGQTVTWKTPDHNDTWSSGPTLATAKSWQRKKNCASICYNQNGPKAHGQTKFKTGN